MTFLKRISNIFNENILSKIVFKKLMEAQRPARRGSRQSVRRTGKKPGNRRSRPPSSGKRPDDVFRAAGAKRGRETAGAALYYTGDALFPCGEKERLPGNNPRRLGRNPFPGGSRECRQGEGNGTKRRKGVMSLDAAAMEIDFFAFQPVPRPKRPAACRILRGRAGGQAFLNRRLPAGTGERAVP